MSITPATANAPDCWGELALRVDMDGSARHPHVRRLTGRSPGARDLSDAVHAVCAIHGAHPGAIDCARARNAQPHLDSWLHEAVTGFALERAYLAALVAAAGPLPSTPGQAETVAALVQQRHTIGALAASERVGCSAGGVVALLLDWPAIRAVLDAAAKRFALDQSPPTLPSTRTTQAMVEAAATGIGAGRALRFGADQLLAQHRGLWDLLEARAGARGD